MDWLEAIVLGIVEGLTEFLPISSSAHLSIVGRLFFGGTDPGAAFTAVSQLGAQTAVIVYFARDIGRVVAAWFGSIFGRTPRNDPDARMGWLIIIGSIPIVVAGLLFEDVIETTLRNLWITVAMLVIFGAVLLLADLLAKKRHDLEDLTWWDGVAFGFAQMLSLVPGVSRSGATISGGLFLGYKREAATRYSFLLSIPAVFGSGLYQLKEVPKDPSLSWPPTIVATILAFVVALAVIHWLLKYVSTHSFNVFVWYRFGLAALVAGLLLGGVMTA